MSGETLKRFDRIVHIYVQLQSKNIVRARELAERWDVSLRTIYRDIRTLEQAGIPIYGEAGTGYRIVEGYRLPPVSLTPEEAKSFVSAQKLMGKFMDVRLQADFESALLKIKAVLRSSEKESISRLEKYIFVQNLQSPRFPPNLQGLLTTLLQSLERKLKIQLRYRTVQEERVTERVLEPVGIVHESNYWYLYAYCHLRKDYRQFRTDRIQTLSVLEEKFEFSHPTIHEHLQEQLKKRGATSVTPVRIRTSRQTAIHMRWERDYFGFVQETEIGQQVEMLFKARDLEEALPRWLLMFADDLQLVEPSTLLHRIRQLAKQIQAHLQNLTPDQL